LNATYQGNEVQRPPLFKISIGASGSRSPYNFGTKEYKSSPRWTSTAGEGSAFAHVFVLLVLICWLHWPPRVGEYVSVREHKKEANRIMYKSRPTEVEYTTMRRMCP
jgi:hypothetical protein